MSGYIEKVAKGGFIVFVLSMLTSALGYLLRLYTARNLSVEDFGLFYAILAFVSLFWILKELGIGPALAKYIPEFRVKKMFSEVKTSIATVMLIQFAIGFIIFAIFFIFSDYISLAFFHNIEAKPVLQILAFELFIGTTIIRPILQGFQKIKAYALVEFVRISSLFMIVIFTITLGITGIALSYLLASIIVQIIFLVYIFNILSSFGGRTKIEFDRKIFSFGFFVFIGGLAGFIVSYTDTLVLTFFRTLDEVGFYQVAMPTSQLLWVFSGSLTIVLFPIMSEIWAKNQKSTLAEGVSLLVKFSLLLVMPFALIMISFPEIVINLIFGPSYLPAALALQILGIGAIFYTLMSILSTAINAIGKPAISMKVVWATAIFNLVGNILLVPFMGIIGAAIVSMLSFFIGFLILTLYTKKYIKVAIPWLCLGKTFLIGIATLLIVYALKSALVVENALLETAICLSVSFAFYFLMVSKLKVVTRSDLDIFKKSNIYVPKAVRTIVLKFIK